jgi:hypothetical protein
MIFKNTKIISVFVISSCDSFGHYRFCCLAPYVLLCTDKLILKAPRFISRDNFRRNLFCTFSIKSQQPIARLGLLLQPKPLWPNFPEYFKHKISLKICLAAYACKLNSYPTFWIIKLCIDKKFRIFLTFCLDLCDYRRLFLSISITFSRHSSKILCQSEGLDFFTLSVL